MEEAVCDQDISSAWIKECDELDKMNKRILLHDFPKQTEIKNCDLEFRVLEKVTCTNKHVPRLKEYHPRNQRKNRYDWYRVYDYSAVEICSTECRDQFDDDYEPKLEAKINHRHSFSQGQNLTLSMNKAQSAHFPNIGNSEFCKQSTNSDSPKEQIDPPAYEVNLTPVHKDSGDDVLSSKNSNSDIKAFSATKKLEQSIPMNVINEIDEKSTDASPLKIGGHDFTKDNPKAPTDHLQFSEKYIQPANPVIKFHRGSMNQEIGGGILNLLRAEDSGCFTPRQESSYINASYIHHPFIKDYPKAHIITQAPMSHTLTDFLEMIWENKVKIVIMLCNFKETGIDRKTEKYYGPVDISLRIGEFVIKTISATKDDYLRTKKIEIRKVNELGTLQLKLFKVRRWNDKSSFDQSQFPAYLQMLKTIHGIHVNERGVEYRKTPPIVIHCKAGIGRSGVLSASLFIYEYLLAAKTKFGEGAVSEEMCKEYNLGISIFATVRKMRECRWGLIMLPKQLFLLYQLTTFMIEHFSDL